MTTKSKKPVPEPETNGISWIAQDAQKIAQAVQRLAFQCPLTAKVRCLEKNGPEPDPIRAAWDEKYGEPVCVTPEKNNEDYILEPKPVPKFTDIVRQHEQLQPEPST